MQKRELIAKIEVSNDNFSNKSLIHAFLLQNKKCSKNFNSKVRLYLKMCMFFEYTDKTMIEKYVKEIRRFRFHSTKLSYHYQQNPHKF